MLKLANKGIQTSILSLLWNFNGEMMLSELRGKI